VFSVVLLASACGADARPPTEAVPRTPPVALTPTEYNNTIADLLGFPRDGESWPARPEVANRLSAPRYIASVFAGRIPQAPWPWHLPSEPGSDGFEGIAQGQSPSPYQIEELERAAKHFAAFALLAPRFFTCEGWSKLGDDERAACTWSSLQKFTQRAYRRPITDDERARLKSLWEQQKAFESDEVAIALTVAGILQSPHFLYKIETPQSDRSATAKSPDSMLSGWELATRLSYLLWDTMPDQALFAAADRGELATTAGVREQAERMLNHDRALAAIVRFHHQWLETDDVLLIEPARRAFGPVFGLTAIPAAESVDGTVDDSGWPATLGPVRHAMRFETELFVERVLFDGEGTFTALMNDNTGFTTDATAPIYGPDAKRDPQAKPVVRHFSGIVASLPQRMSLEFYPTTFPASQRAGILTLPSVLALGAYAVQPGPILRGKRVLERVACMNLGTPIQGAEAALPPDRLTVESTNRERTHNATKNAPCSACHQFLNPPGFAFENYDAIGRWRDEDNGQPVDASGSITLTGGETIEFDDGIELVQKLSSSNRVRDCYALHWTRYALGNHVRADAPMVKSVQQHFRENDSVKDLLATIVTSNAFRMRPTGDST
jgi:hypothetical protein